MKSLTQYIAEHISVYEQSTSSIKLDMEWIDNDKPVHTKSGIDVKIDSVDMKEIPNQIHGTAYYSSGPIEGWIWDETGRCLQAKDEKGNPFRPGDEETLVKKMLEFKLEYAKLSEVVRDQDLISCHPYFGTAYVEERNFRHDLKWNGKVLEKYGAYDGQVELVNELVDCIVHSFNIRENIKKISLTSKDLEEYAKERKIKMTIFFDKLEIIINSSQNSYLPDLSRYDEEKNRFDKVTIYVNRNDLKNNPIAPTISSILTHELTHAYEDFRRNEKHLDWTLKDLAGDPLYKEAERMMQKPQDELEEFVGKILYAFNKSETNAFYSEFTTLLDSLYKKDIVIEYNEALGKFKETEPYKNIVWVISILNNSHGIISDFIRSYWNNATGDSMTTNKCIKKLKWMANKKFQKMTEILPKIYFDWISKKKVDESIGLIDIRPSVFDYKKDNFFRKNIEMQLSQNLY